MKPLKEPKDYEEQIYHLEKVHQLIINNHEQAKGILKRINYYRLSAYGIGLKRPDDKEKYILGISLETIYRLYQFDRELRSIIMPILEEIEVEFKSSVSYCLAMEYGAEGYTNSSNFMNIIKKDGISVHQDVMGKFEGEKQRQANLPCVLHHNEIYDGHFPIWAAVELFTFGMVTSLFGIMKSKDRKKVAVNYSMNAKHLESNMLAVNELRNKCAHYNRIYNMPFKQQPYLFTEYTLYRSNKVFPIFITMKILLHNEKLWRDFLSSLSRLVLSYPEVRLDFMGFPKNWLEVLS